MLHDVRGRRLAATELVPDVLIGNDQGLDRSVATFQLTIRANLAQDQRLPSTPFLVFLGIYLVFTIVWTVSFFRRFLRTP